MMIYIFFFYIAIVIVAVLTCAHRNGPILVEGFTLFKLQFSFVILLLATMLISGSLSVQPYAIAVVVLFLVLFVVSAVLREYFIIFKFDATKTNEKIEKSLKMILIEFDKEQRIYRVHFDNCEGSISQSQKLLGSGILSFGDAWNPKKKKVFLKLLIKQFEGVLPRIVINLNKKNG